jgi:glycosyltransferase involved in cell wall biosynthesis
MSRDKIRVLMISKALVVGIYQRKLEHIAAQGIDLTLIVPPAWKDERGTTPLERVYTQGYRMDVLPLRFNGNFHLHFYAGLRETMQSVMPDIVHIDEEPYNLAAWQAMFHARRLKAKTLFFSWQNLRRDYPPPFRWGERWVLRHVDYALMGTDSAGEVWRAKGYTGAMTTLPQFGTDTDLFQPLEEIPERRDRFTIGYIGRLVEEKGVQVLLRAAAQLSGDWQLHILGSGPHQAALTTLASQLGIAERVHFDGQRPSAEIPPYYHQLDVLALPSLTRPNWKEQFGRVLVEAMASGIPVIGSDSGAIPGVIGEAGMIVPEGDATALSESLAALQQDFTLRAHLSMLGRERALAQFTHEQIARQTVDVYRALV